MFTEPADDPVALTYTKQHRELCAACEVEYGEGDDACLLVCITVPGRVNFGVIHPRAVPSFCMRPVCISLVIIRTKQAGRPESDLTAHAKVRQQSYVVRAPRGLMVYSGPSVSAVAVRVLEVGVKFRAVGTELAADGRYWYQLGDTEWVAEIHEGELGVDWQGLHPDALKPRLKAMATMFNVMFGPVFTVSHAQYVAAEFGKKGGPFADMGVEMEFKLAVERDKAQAIITEFVVAKNVAVHLSQSKQQMERKFFQAMDPTRTLLGGLEIAEPVGHQQALERKRQLAAVISEMHETVGRDGDKGGFFDPGHWSAFILDLYADALLITPRPYARWVEFAPESARGGVADFAAAVKLCERYGDTDCFSGIGGPPVQPPLCPLRPRQVTASSDGVGGRAQPQPAGGTPPLSRGFVRWQQHCGAARVRGRGGPWQR
jgi:hypothetical protein